MADELKQFLENDVLSDDVKVDIMEAWNIKLEEAREEITAEIRDEFARKYNKDKSEIVEAMNAMIQGVLTPVIEELNAEKTATIAEQVRYKKAVRENIQTFNNFSKKVLTAEVSEFRQDRKAVAEGFNKMNKFVQNQVGAVIEDINVEKKRIAEEAVQTTIKAKKELQETKAKLIKETAETASKFIKRIVSEEMTQLKDELVEARKNELGSRIFESVIAEVEANFFNKNKAVQQLKNAIKERDAKLDEAKKALSDQTKVLEESQSQARVAKDRLVREKIVNELLSPLGNEKREIMGEMLDKQPTQKLRESFERYLPSVMDDTTSSKSKMLTEGSFREVTGDRKNIVSEAKKGEENKLISDYVTRFKSITTN